MARISPPVFLLVFAVSASAALESATETTNDNHFFISIKSKFKAATADLCLDALPDGDVVLKDCTEGATSQLWYLEDDKIVNYNGQCLDSCRVNCVYELPQRNTLLGDCRSDDVQRWASYGHEIVNLHYGTCLDVCNEPKCTPNLDATTFKCHQKDDQKWEFILGGYVSPTSVVTNAAPNA